MKDWSTSTIFRALALCAAGFLIVLLLASGYLHWRVHRFDELAFKAGATHGVDTRLVLAIIRKESNFKPRAVGRAGEIGLMQVTPAAALEWARATGNSSFKNDDLFNPETNIQAGTWYLSRAMGRWAFKTDPLPYALAEYNAGRSIARQWAAADEGEAVKFMARISYPSTKSYIEDILSDYCSRSAAPSNCMSYRRR